EYALIQDVNDNPGQARELAQLLRGLLCHVNLIPLNPTAECDYQPSTRERILAFRRELNRLGIASTVRLGRGIDIQAGCGQLRSRQRK
ncbi:MAG: 23S rRNA (adenine(2503)-C2)-methyltransferase, partial [Chloroflexi bacterium]|nr:23S rRNA (adenine(2503)-C2)-methyltransferase [Chloroflexota bacterium]